MNPAKYIGYLLKAQGLSSDDFWNLDYYNQDLIDAFYEFKSEKRADTEAHKMHRANPKLRQAAIDFIDGELDKSTLYMHDKFFDDKADCQVFADKINSYLSKAGYVAKAAAYQAWLYDHVAMAKGYTNPYRVWVKFWDRDLKESTLKSICDKIGVAIK